LLSMIVMVCWGITGQAQPPNDLEAGAFPITNGVAVSGTTVGATVDSPGGTTTCGTSITAPGVWYFVIGTGGPLTVSTCNAATYDTKISVFSGAPGNLTCEGGNDDGTGCTGFTSEFTLASTNVGTGYYVLVHGFQSSTGTFDLTATIGPAPTGNDVCGGATPISCGQTLSDSTTNATLDTPPSCGVSPTSAGVWFTTMGDGGIYTANTCTGTTLDTRIYVYEGPCGSLGCVGSNDDDCGFQSSFTWNTILVTGFGTNTGTFDLTLDCIALPTNDQPCNADPLAFGANPYAHISLTADSNEVNPGPGTGASVCNSNDGWCSFELDVDNSAWFTFDAPASGSVTLYTDGFDSQLAMYTATDCNDYNTFVAVAGNDDSADDFDPNVNIFGGGFSISCLVPGQTYYVQVDGFNGAESISAAVFLQDNGGSIPVADAGDCQSRYIGYAPVANDTNFLNATATGDGPFTYEWSVVSGDSTIFFQDDFDSLSVIAVQPNQTTVYEVTITDGRGCTSTDQVTVEYVDVSCFLGIQMCYNPANAGTAVVLDWENDGMGNPLAAGTPITNQYANLGINISTDNNNGPDFAAIFDSGNPTGGDHDLGTPNQNFGGPGIGNGGQMGQTGANTTALDNILIIQERYQMCGNVFCTPDDDANGGTISFDFDDPYTVETIVIVDADDGNPSGAVVTIDANTGSYTLNFPSLGDNSVITLPIFEDGVLHMDISFNGSGAVGAVNLRSEAVTFCAATADVPGLLGRPGYNLGTCNDVCTSSNPSIAPPPACEDLIVSVTTDDFASETRWEIVERGSGIVVGSRQFVTANDLQTLNDTFCVDPRKCYDITIFDSFGDGICCSPIFGNGTWEVIFGGTSTASPTAGSFGASETISVGTCINKGSQAQAFMDDENPLKVAVYPNPSSDRTFFKLASALDGEMSVEVYNLQGTHVGSVFSGQVQAESTQTVDFNATTLPAGTYIYRVSINDVIQAGKFQIVH